ncbi:MULTISPECIES: 4Fe-4S dicluster domain-containing protein [Bacillaceae]|uniref:4Fe-4S dicluster domain-containing protein n=1 Tax=Bacillaceae TaxID=186817 RepID=UPI001BDF25B7|nr:MULTISPECIES: 4Fe-4S dicluster domain-containing protein [Bacillaceae]MDX8366846.1 4Fe-4S dicluster domain-containing protein [Cytobacillus sp. IB215665]
MNLLKTLIGGLAAYELLSLMKGGNKTVLRPPGAAEEDEFLALCVRCGKCNQACPYDSIKMGTEAHGFGLGTPFIEARENPCRLCEDFPCVEVCPTTALSGINQVEDVQMGTAIIDPEHCIAYEGVRCEVCYRECPLIDEAIKLDIYLKPGDDIHAVFAPIIDVDKCVGCGICEQRCVVDNPVAIRVKPREVRGLF